MSNKNFVGIIFFFLLIGSLLGWFLRGCTIPASSNQITVKDSVSTKSIEQPAVVKDSSFSFTTDKNRDQLIERKLTVKDSSGQKAELRIKSKIDGDSVNVFYEIRFTPIKFIEMITREIVKPQLEYIQKPFYLDNWFYTSLVLFAVFILSLFYR